MGKKMQQYHFQTFTILSPVVTELRAAFVILLIFCFTPYQA
jgi:hypothetical protein